MVMDLGFVSLIKGEHVGYVLWLHQELLKQGCTENIPQIKSRVLNGKLAIIVDSVVLLYSSFN